MTFSLEALASVSFELSGGRALGPAFLHVRHLWALDLGVLYVDSEGPRVSNIGAACCGLYFRYVYSILRLYLPPPIESEPKLVAPA